MEHNNFEQLSFPDYSRWKIIFAECPDGPLKVWSKPEPGLEYVIGVDTSTGLSEDYSVASVFTRNIPFEQVAEFRVKWSVVDTAEFVTMLGYWYNTAMVTVETNYPGNAIQDALVQQYRYPNNYQMERHIDQNAAISTKFGFQTTQASKWMLIRELQSALKEKSVIIKSEESLDELGNFIYVEDQTRTGAASGFNDDTVIANMLAIHTCLIYPTAQRPIRIEAEDAHTRRMRRECAEFLQQIIKESQTVEETL